MSESFASLKLQLRTEKWHWAETFTRSSTIYWVCFMQKKFQRTVLCRAVKNKNSNFREFRSFMGQFGAENDIFIFKALHVRASFPRLFLECLPSIYECFMFLEFWLKLFIKIAPDENVFFSLNSREIAENDGFWSEMRVNRG